MVKVLFFASLRETVGTDALQLETADALALDELLALLRPRVGEVAYRAMTAESVRIAVNQELLAGPATIRPGDEVAFLPPVTGG